MPIERIIAAARGLAGDMGSRREPNASGLDAGAIYGVLDRPFAATLVGVMATHALALAGLLHVPRPEPLEAETVNTHWTSVLFLEMPEPRLPKGSNRLDRISARQAGGLVASRGRRPRRAERPMRVPAGVGLVGTLADARGLGGALEDAVTSLLGEGQDHPFARLRDRPDENRSNLAAFRRPSRGASQALAASIGRLATSGSGEVGLGEKGEARVDPPVPKTADRLGDTMESNEIAVLIRANMAAVRACYRKPTRYDQALRGRIVVEARISATGRAADTGVVENRLDYQEIGACLASEVMRWSFPEARRAYLVSLPFILAPRGG